jgi:hypothetical protein
MAWKKFSINVGICEQPSKHILIPFIYIDPLMVHLLKEFQCLLPCLHFTCPKSILLLNTLQTSSTLQHFPHLSTEPLPIKTPKSHLPSLICSCTKVNMLALIASHGIRWKSCIVFSCCPSFT